MAQMEVENAFEKLSREIHQMKVTGGIHNEWLEEPKGYLLKPDFKRKEQHVGAGGKKLINSVRSIHFRMPGASTYRPRWFVLDGMTLRYYKSEEDEVEAGSILLANVNAVLPSRVADAPEHALDLVCADRIYTIAANTREDLVRWATVLTLVLQGRFRPKNSRRRDSMPGQQIEHTGQAGRKSSVASLKSNVRLSSDEALSEQTGEQDCLKQLITATYHNEGPLRLALQATTSNEVVVSTNAKYGEAQDSLLVGDTLISINDDYFYTIRLQDAVSRIAESPRPVTLRFLRITYPHQKEKNIAAEGWVLAREPATSNYRLRLLRVTGNELQLFKSDLGGCGRQKTPCFMYNLNDIRDIRLLNDQREDAKENIQGHSKQWGITLESSSIFTFYVKSQKDQTHWVDIFSSTLLPKRKSSVNIHPIKVIPFLSVEKVINPILEGLQKKVYELTTKVDSRYFLILRGKLKYYRTEACVRLCGAIKLEYVADILIKKKQSDLKETWFMTLEYIVPTSLQKYRRRLSIQFENKDSALLWARTVENETNSMTGRSFNLSTRPSELESKPLESLKTSFSGSNVDAGDEQHPGYSNKTLAVRKCMFFDESRGWVFIKQNGVVGLRAFHLRFLLFNKHELLVYKAEVENDPSNCSVFDSKIDLRTVKDVRAGDPNNMDSHEFEIELLGLENSNISLVALSVEQQDLWISSLSWAADYYSISGTNRNELQESPLPNHVADPGTHSDLSAWFLVKELSTQYYCTLSPKFFSFFKGESDFKDEWGDFVSFIELDHIVSVHCILDGMFTFDLKFHEESGKLTNLHLKAPSESIAKHWVIQLCAFKGLVLEKVPEKEEWSSTNPKQDRLWKLDVLNNVYRKRFVTLLSDKISCQESPNGRLISLVPLDLFGKAVKLQICGDSFEKASYQLQVFIEEDLASLEDRHECMTLAFETLESLNEWCNRIYETVNILRTWKGADGRSNLTPNEEIQSLPGSLFKNVSFESEVLTSPELTSNQKSFGYQPRGWMHYQCFNTKSEGQDKFSDDHQVSLRYFVLWGSNLCMYKHEVLAHEMTAICYRLFCCSQISRIEQICTTAQDNSIKLDFSGIGIRVILNPRSDKEDLLWRKCLSDANALFGDRICAKGFTMQDSPEQSIFQVEEQIRKVALKSGNVMEWDEKTWFTKYYMLTNCRLSSFATYADVVSADSDVLETYTLQSIAEVKFMESGLKLPGDVIDNESCFEIKFQCGKVILVKAFESEECVEWVRILKQEMCKA